MHRGRDGLDLLLEEAERVRVGDHERRHRLIHRGGNRGGRQQPASVHRDLRHLIAAEGGAGGIGAVCARGDEDAAAGIAPVRVKRPHEQHPEQLSLGAGGRLQADRVETAHGGERRFQSRNQLERTLRQLIGYQGVKRGQARKPRQRLVDDGVVLHGA